MKNLKTSLLLPLTAVSVVQFASLTHALAGDRPLTKIGELSKGAPTNLGTKLGDMSYIKVETQRLARGKVLWINWDYLESIGFDTSKREITPAIEKAILDAFAWGVPGKGEPADAFTAEKKTFYADRYGGDMLAGNMGSGRAASAGTIQTKGIGRTALVTTIGDGHSNGVAALDEAIVESIYGEVGQRLPRGANRVIAIIDRGTTYTHNDGRVQQNALIIRQDPLRPAHYLKNLYGRGPLMGSEDARTQQAIQYFLEAFPVGKELAGAPKSEKVRAAVLKYADTIADVYAAAFARKIYHGATSISNIEVDGRFIDYGTMTTVPDYGRIQRISGADHNGVTTELKSILMLEFLGNLRDHMPKAMGKRLPTNEEMVARFETQYEKSMIREFLSLTGLNDVNVRKVESTKEGALLGKLLEKIAVYGSREVMAGEETAYLTKFNVNRILVKLAKATDLDPVALEGLLQAEIPEAKDREILRELARTYSTVLRSVKNLDRAELISNAIVRNAEHKEGYAWDVWREARKTVAEYAQQPSRKLIADHLDGIIAKMKTPVRQIRSCLKAF